MPTFSGSDPCSKIFNTTTEATSAPAPANSGHIGIVLARCTPPTLAIDANGPSRTNLTAGPIIARIPADDPRDGTDHNQARREVRGNRATGTGQHGLPEPVHQICPEQEAAGHPQQSPENTHHGALAQHPAEQPDRLCADGADGPHHRPPVLDGQQDGVHGDEQADQDAGHHSQVETLCSVLEHGRLMGPGRARCCNAGDDAVDIGRDVRASSRQHERGRGVAGRAEHARGDVHGGGQQHVAAVDALDAVELRERPTQMRRSWRQAGDAQLLAEL